jgi:midasin
MAEVFQRDGDAPLRRLQAALDEQPASSTLPHSSSSTPATLPSSDPSSTALAIQEALKGVVWTRSMKRLYTLLDRCLAHQEPVLLVGETGTGKTTVCQLLALMRAQHLHMLNCNQHTEASDFLGGFRPARSRVAALGALQQAAAAIAGSALLAAASSPAPRVPADASALGPADIGELLAALQSAVATCAAWVQSLPDAAPLPTKKSKAPPTPSLESSQQELQQLEALLASATAAAASARAPFQWVDGPLVTAMRQGDMILVDEINLAEDAVLERLNRCVGGWVGVGG